MPGKSELADRIAARGWSRAAASSAVDAVLDEITAALTAGERVTLTGFGTFESAARGARTARNPRTGDAIDVPATTVARFHPGATLRARVAAGVAVPPAALSAGPVGALAPVSTAAPAAAKAAAPVATKAAAPKKASAPKKAAPLTKAELKAEADRKKAASKNEAAKKAKTAKAAEKAKADAKKKSTKAKADAKRGSKHKKK